MQIVLAVCGSISAYKSYDLARLYVKAGHKVKVVLTAGAEKFIMPETFLHLGVEDVYSSKDDFNIKKKMFNVLHIDLKNWLDILVIAPASANTLAKISNGFCDDLLSSIFLTVLNKPILIFPAMNTNMLEHPFTQENFKKLESLNHIFIHPSDSGLLACGDEGAGKLPTPENIFEFTEAFSLQTNDREIVITTGSTIAPLDPVRYLTNPASGKTGYKLAKIFLAQGYKVTLIYGHLSTFPKDALVHHPRLKLIEIRTTKDMAEAVHHCFDHCHAYISTAAISDIQFDLNEQKVKKKKTSELNLSFTWAEDILKSVLDKKKKQIIIGFAAETDPSQNHFLEKWQRKPVDLLVGNYVNSGETSSVQGFGTDQNTYSFIKDGKEDSKEVLTKDQLSTYLFQFVDTFHD